MKRTQTLVILHKWAVVSHGPPEPKGLIPVVKNVPDHEKLKPADYKIPYILRTFIKDKHQSDIQHIENRGMYKEELSIERSRFPRSNKTIVVHTDGSVNEREFEFAVPPMVVLFNDRRMSFRLRQEALAKINKLKKIKSWEVEATGARSDVSYCNALCFPYCVPKLLTPRKGIQDPLTARKGGSVEPNDQ